MTAVSDAFFVPDGDGWLATSHSLVAGKLTRAMRAELGL